MLLFAIGVCALIIVTWIWIKKMRLVSLPNNIPHPPTLPIIGNAHQIDHVNGSKSIHEFHLKYGPLVKLNLLGMEILSISDPEISDYLLKNIDICDRKGWPWDNDIYCFGGSVLFAISGEPWRQRRKILNHDFSSSSVRNVIPRIVVVIRRALKWLDEHRDTPIDLDAFFTRVTMDIISLILFGNDFDCISQNATSEILFNGITAINNQISDNNIPFYQYMITPSRLKFFRSRRRVYDLIHSIIKQHQQQLNSGAQPSCVLDTLIQSGESPNSIVHEILGLLFAGHDTTAHTMTWFIYRMNMHKDIKNNIMSEIDKCIGESENGNAFQVVEDLDHANQFNYVVATINEVLRYYPPATIHPVQVFKDTTIGGYNVRSGANIMITQYSTMRAPEYWDDPEEFIPARFFNNPPMRIPKNKPNLTPGMIYAPFLRGPHVCIGMYLALSELKLVLPSILKNFEISLVSDKPVIPLQKATLQPAEKILVTVRKRPKI